MQRVIFVASCGASLLLGCWLGARRFSTVPPVTVGEVPSTLSSLRHETEQNTPGDSTQEKVNTTTRRLVLLRRTLAACETQALWQWLEQNPEGKPEICSEVVKTLIDRLGWQAWSQALEVADPKVRERVSYRILYEFSLRDPWKAYEEWKAHRAEFPSPAWASGVISECSLAAASVSADKLIETFQQIPQDDSNEMMMVEFAKDFDFRKLLDYLANTEKLPYTETDDTLTAWAKRSPLEAAEWLAANPRYLEKEYHESEVSGTLRAIASAEMDDASRRQALDAISRVRPELVDQAWLAVAGSSEGKISAPALQTVDLAGRRGEYLFQVLEETRLDNKLDASWEQVSLPERQQVLAAVEHDWAEQNPSPLNAKIQARWSKMVRAAWGISP
ncbi:hypothetical protein [Haloferula sp. BvORR071]|uniref:hypothetical protein n=1 Tax=Haloferula sp. BvORR071 TaxID=1396141 RepID=UPI002240FF58|nr:hypothetical protein [Haloferula sp. BvORR071]